MAFVGTLGREEKKVGRSIVLREVVFVISRPDHVRVDLQLPGDRFQGWPVLAVTDDHQPRVRGSLSNLGESLKDQLETAPRRQLSDGGNQHHTAGNAVMIADVVAVRMKLPVIQRRGGEDWRTIAEQFSKRIIDHAEEIGAPEK